MLKTVDDGFKNVTDALVAKGRWDTTLMVVSSDNGTQLRFSLPFLLWVCSELTAGLSLVWIGGIGPGNNFPLRGSKMTPWQVADACNSLEYAF